MEFAIKNGINRTVHAGESAGPQSIKNGTPNLGDLAVIKRIVIEAIEDCQNHNVKYVEFRFRQKL